MAQRDKRKLVALVAGFNTLRSVKTVAILGASGDRAKFGNKAVRAFHQCGYAVYPINLNLNWVEGIAAFRSIIDVPVKTDLVSAYLPPSVLLKTLSEIAAKSCGELWLNPGTDSPEVLAEVCRLGLKVVRTCSFVAIGVSPADF